MEEMHLVGVVGVLQFKCSEVPSGRADIKWISVSKPLPYEHIRWIESKEAGVWQNSSEPRT